MTLYEINSAILACYTEVVDPETGEISEEVFDQELLENLKLQLADKVDGIACWIKNLTAEAEALKAEEAKLAKRRKAAENRIESLKSYLVYACAGQRFRGIRSDVQFRTTTSVVVDNMAKLPDEFQRIKTTVEPDKVAIKKALQQGRVPGAHLESNLAAIIK